MADIFLSYAREDIAKAKRLDEALQAQGWTVFWDRTSMRAGHNIHEVIEKAIEQAGCMIVAWSVSAKKSDWVNGEADIGRERKILIPVLFEAVDVPIPFKTLHTEDLVSWKGDSKASAFLALCDAIEQRIGKGTKPENEPVMPAKPPGGFTRWLAKSYGYSRKHSLPVLTGLAIILF